METEFADDVLVDGSLTGGGNFTAICVDAPHLFVQPVAAGDFNDDSTLDIADLDILRTEFQLSRHRSLYDLTDDSNVNRDDQFAWIHTVSAAYRFSFFKLTLNPLDPTQYLVDGDIRDMYAREIMVEILEDDGSTSTETHTLYFSEDGPMLEFQVSGVLKWSPAKAYTLRDAYAENDRLMNPFPRWNRATSLDKFKELHVSVLGVP